MFAGTVKLRLVLGPAAICLGFVTALAAAQATAGPRLKVAVSILPQAYFVERVGGELVEVQAVVGPGLSPHSFEPSPKQLASLTQAQVYFRVGIDFEEALLPRLERMSKNLRIVDTRAGVPLRRFTAAESAYGARAAEEHSHHHHEAGRPDPHIWLSPPLAKIQAQTVCDTLAELDPANAEQYRRNLATLVADLDRVHAQITSVLAPLKGREVFVFHPAFGYFLDAYGLKQVPVEIEGKEPTSRQLKELIERAKAGGIKVIFVQPQFSRKSATAIAEAIGGVVVPMDDLPRDYLRNLEEMAAKIKTALHAGAELGPDDRESHANRPGDRD